MVTQMERQYAVTQADGIVNAFLEANPKLGDIFLRLLANYAQSPTPIHLPEFPDLAPHQEELKNYMVMVVKEIVSKADAQPAEYKTSQLAEVFGVSITTIHKWVEQGRFVGVEKGTKNKHLVIADDVLWVSPSGRKMMVREVAMNFEKQQNALGNLEDEGARKDNIIKSYREELVNLEAKHGSLETLMQKQHKTDKDRDDLDNWLFYLDQLKNL